MIKLNYAAPLFIGLILLAIALIYRPASIIETNHPALPDAIMEDVVSMIFDKQGKPRLKIVTPRMVHYLESDATDLTTPEVTLYRQSPQPWRITAEYAKATEGANKVDFWDNVIIQHTGDGNTPTTLIKTPTLTVHPDSQTAQTRDAITLIQPSIVVKSVGMFADMDSGNIKLLSEAVGEYVPDKL
jgi:lipopolysaccharide export system protein LptC